MRNDVVAHESGGMHFYSAGQRKIECPCGCIEIMTTEIAHRAESEGPEISPGDRGVGRMKANFFARPQPQIPIKSFRYGHGLFWFSIDRRSPSRCRNPCVIFAHLADHTSFDPLDHLTDVFTGVPAVTQLSCNASLFGDFRDEPRFGYVVR